MHDELNIESEEGSIIEEEEADPLWELDDEETPGSSKRSFLFGDMEVSKEQTEVHYSNVLYSKHGTRPNSDKAASIA
ncbi:unnamed protein product [Haemonchus placei]|uniref:Uncharacterized protein n=1 Tax=Haemonchus placei TaxID=6290 RepID=A0A0N4WS85_HAEPC|nr:unnamed protein product [Haemonchus placei]